MSAVREGEAMIARYNGEWYTPICIDRGVLLERLEYMQATRDETRTAQRLILVDEVARRLGVHPESVRRLVRKNQLTGDLMGNTYVFDDEYIDRYTQLYDGSLGNVGKAYEVKPDGYIYPAPGSPAIPLYGYTPCKKCGRSIVMSWLSRHIESGCMIGWRRSDE